MTERSEYFNSLNDNRDTNSLSLFLKSQTDPKKKEDKI